jgi:hypothetical protein
MSDFADERAVFETYFQNNWDADPVTGFVVQYENVKFTQPVDKTWVRFSISASNTKPASPGLMKVRTNGFVYLSIFIPKDLGTVDYKTITDKFAKIWDGIHLKMASGMAFFNTTSYKTLGDHNGFFMAEAVCMYRRDVDKVAPTPGLDGGSFGASNSDNFDGGHF